MLRALIRGEIMSARLRTPGRFEPLPARRQPQMQSSIV